MGIRKRLIAVCLAAAMAVAGVPAEGLVLETKAAPNTQENGYMGVMLTKEEFQKFSYTDAEADWSEYVPGENENGLANYEARYVADGRKARRETHIGFLCFGGGYGLYLSTSEQYQCRGSVCDC